MSRGLAEPPAGSTIGGILHLLHLSHFFRIEVLDNIKCANKPVSPNPRWSSWIWRSAVMVTHITERSPARFRLGGEIFFAHTISPNRVLARAYC